MYIVHRTLNSVQCHLAKGVRKVAFSLATMASHREAEVTQAPDVTVLEATHVLMLLNWSHQWLGR